MPNRFFFSFDAIRLGASICLFAVLIINVACQKQSPVSPDSKQVALISGASMAPTLLGKHLVVNCDDCDFTFAVDSNKLPVDNFVVCPNCGFHKNDVSNLEIQEPDQVELDIDAIIHRWDIVAFEFADSNDKGVKRVVGLPGEYVSINKGNILVYGTVVSKSQPNFEMLMLVHDAKFKSKSGNGPKWTSSSSTPPIFSFSNQRCFRAINRNSPIDFFPDFYPFNQNTARGELNQVDDIQLRFLMKKPSDSIDFYFRIGSKYALFRIDQDEIAIVPNDNITSSSVIEHPWPVDKEWHQVVISVLDQQLEINVGDGGLSRIRSPKFMHDSLNFEPEQKFGFVANDLADFEAINFDSIKILRDVYYFPGQGGRTEFVLQDDEYLLLGDNCPVSTDSRTWPVSAVKKDQILGIVKPPKR